LERADDRAERRVEVVRPRRGLDHAAGLLAGLPPGPAGHPPGDVCGRGRCGRRLARGDDDEKPPPAELTAMEKHVAEAMEDGAFGLSTSLIYVPGRFASTEEIIALAKVAARYGGRYITHQRSGEEEIGASRDEGCRLAPAGPVPA